jgi:hypothetical protein
MLPDAAGNAGCRFHVEIGAVEKGLAFAYAFPRGNGPNKNLLTSTPGVSTWKCN